MPTPVPVPFLDRSDLPGDLQQLATEGRYGLEHPEPASRDARHDLHDGCVDQPVECVEQSVMPTPLSPQTASAATRSKSAAKTAARCRSCRSSSPSRS
jgi:hypothetical protein